MENQDSKNLLSEGRKVFKRLKDAGEDNRAVAIKDIRFAKLGEQWPENIRKDREATNRPCLTINRMPSFIRQVVNDSRQNKPQIKVKAVDDKADPETAQTMNGLIRNIEYTSNADVAYDTAIENAVAGGFGYIRVTTDYAFDDSFEMDIGIERVLNPMCVYEDPNSTSVDGSDWMEAFVTERLSKAEYEKKYADAAKVDWDADEWKQAGTDWINDEGVLVAEWWHREEVEREIVLLSNGLVFSAEQLETDPDVALGIQTGALQIVKRRMAKSYKVTQTIMSGVDVLEVNEWPGRYIPIVPVYGDEFAVEGKRYFRSLIHPAKDAQAMFNFWRTSSTELVALAPRTPFIGPKGAFDSDVDRWNTINTKSHAFVEYDTVDAEGRPIMPPQRQPLDSGSAAGSLQEAMNAADDMKSIVGLYDASLGARSNETSGRAIMARQREGDTSTFHFIDNLSRAIRHVGKIIIDLIPHVYNEARIIRVLGEDGNERNQPINQQTPKVDPQTGQPVMDENNNPVLTIHNLTVGKYDLAVDAGPSFTTRREEAANQMIELLRAFPQAAPFIGDLLAKNFDWPGADELADRLKKMNPANQQQGLPPQVQQMIQQGQMRIKQLEQENMALKADKQIDGFEAETKRMKVVGDQQLEEAKFGQDVIQNSAVPMSPFNPTAPT